MITRITINVYKLIVKCVSLGLNERIIDLVKKRSQLKQAVAKMVTESCTFLDKTPDKVNIIGKKCWTRLIYVLGHHDEADRYIANGDSGKDLCGERES